MGSYPKPSQTNFKPIFREALFHEGGGLTLPLSPPPQSRGNKQVCFFWMCMLCKGLMGGQTCFFFCGGLFYAPPQPAPQALLAMGPTRCGIKLPLPRAHRRFIDNVLFTMLHDGPVRPPKSQKPTSQLAVHFRLFGFPDSPNTKRPNWG